MLERMLELRRSSLESIHSSERGRADRVLLAALSGSQTANVSSTADVDEALGLSALLRDSPYRTRIFNRVQSNRNYLI